MATWEDVVAHASALPGAEVSTWYRTPAVKVGGKGFVRLRDEADGALVVLCGLAEKEALLASGDPAFFTTAHYDGHGSVLVHLDRVDDAQLRELVTEAWRTRAPARVRQELDDA
ncbi:MmcQ/YjbR family DNA-binding protein [Solicola sp. PLA-1-18]|uniref:MmcQ/YjbR family DNA-binding protein n=1 Tax=Solicola sp. PLA-1-18 TaxID=3380532 RepID=UPI003B7AA80D